jgi:anaerobic selenocysteine-containing dehydrogenase
MQDKAMAATETILTTCPRDCYDACGIAVVKRNGEVAHVRGDPNHAVARGRLCPKCSTGYNREWRDAEARLTAPLVRAGAKGQGEFEEVSWDDAIALAAERLTEIAERHGAATILNTHYTGTLGLIAFAFPLRFFNRLGATEVDPDTVCNKAGHVALEYVYGTSVTGFDPRTIRDSSCVLVWGANPSHSAPHQHERWLRAAPCPVIVVDPIRTATALEADLHLQPFPGSDAALAFSLLHVLVRDGLADRPFLRDHAIGWEELEPLLESCTPTWGESVTGVPARLIEEAAHVYGSGPSLLWLGQGLQRQRTGGNVMRACAILPAVTGNLGKPGAGFLYLNDSDSRGIDLDYVAGAHLSAGPPPPVSQMDLAATLEDPECSRALVAWNINVAASNPEQARLRRALTREDLFTVVVDLFPTDTTAFADVVLPAASFLEFDDLVCSYFDLTVSAQVKATEPLGAALPNQEIFRRLARAMRYEEPELYESDDAILAELMRRTGLEISFDELARVGTVPISDEPVIQFADLTLPTPSGRVEIASARAQEDGHPRVPLPLADSRPERGRLRLLSPASGWLLNDSFANVGKIAQRIGPASLELHPDDAADRGLSEGGEAVVANETGSLTLSVRLRPDLPRGVALSYKGRWPSLEPGGATVNVLVPGEKADMGESTSVHGTEVTVTPA